MGVAFPDREVSVCDARRGGARGLTADGSAETVPGVWRRMLYACAVVTLGCGTTPESSPDVWPHGARDASRDVSPSYDAAVRDGTDAEVRDVTDAEVRDVTDAEVRDGAVDAARDAGAAEPEVTTIPWRTPGYGVFHRDTQNPRGDDVFIGYAGYGVDATGAQTWVTRLYTEALREHGVRHLYAVQGPRDPGYDALEIGNSRLVADLLPRVGGATRILVAAHSSGAFVAHEMFGQLYARGLDPAGATRDRVVYWDLDGGSAGLTTPIVSALRRAYFVWASSRGIASPNASTIRAAGATWPAAGGAVQIVADASGCRSAWCVHMTLINDRPHNPDGLSAQPDYALIDAAHPVATAWLARTNFGAP